MCKEEHFYLTRRLPYASGYGLGYRHGRDRKLFRPVIFADQLGTKSKEDCGRRSFLLGELIFQIARWLEISLTHLCHRTEPKKL